MMPDTAADLPWQHLARSGRVPLLVVRHGQTAWNASGRFLGTSDIPLDEIGRQQVKSLGKALSGTPLSSAYSSPLSRASQTAEAILEGRSLTLQIDPRLAELDQGDLEGARFSEVLSEHAAFFASWQKDPASCRVPGGESFPECQQRGLEALTGIARSAQPGPPVLVVTHNMLIRSVVCAIRGQSLRRFRDIEQDNAAVNLLSFGDGGFVIHQLNQRPSPGSP